MELIRLDNIRKTYHLGEVDVPVLQGISLSIAAGEMVALMGSSGSGKTTLMNILGCLDRPTSGEYWLDGREISRLSPNERALVRTDKLGFVFQNFNLLAKTTAVSNVMLPLDYSLRRPSRSEARQRAEELLEHVGLGERLHHVPSQMSGGQQQRVAIGRSLINQPKLLLADEPTGNLDSHTSVEILKMFQQLNREGITILLVTHDPHVATYANRTIRLVDGRIASDEYVRRAAVAIVTSVTAADCEVADAGSSNAPSPSAAATAVAEETEPELPAATEAAASKSPSTSRRHARPAATALPELLSPTLRTALSALRRNKLRSALTALGIIIGVGAVITMTEIGQGSKVAIEKTIESMGANRIIVRPGATNTGGINQGSGSTVKLTPADVDEVLRQCPAVQDAVPIVGARVQVIHGGRNWVPDRLTGTTPGYLEMRNWDLSEGENLTDDDVRSANAVCILGESVRKELFEEQSPIGQTVRMCGVNLKVIGLLSVKGSSITGQDQDDTLILPWTTLKYRICATPVGNPTVADSTVSTSVNTLNKVYPNATALYPAVSALHAADTPQPVRFPSIDAIIFVAESAELVPQAIEQVTSLLRERHRLRSDAADDFDILNLTEMTNAMASTSTQMGTLLFIVALISLVVGGVGIMNIMMVSVTERTREIGLRMAVGARGHHILRQFLVEAVVLCLLGGMLGIAAGRGASLWVRSVLNWPIQASLTAIVAAVAVSAGVGIIFGFYPAWKASRLDPIESLRYE